MWLFFPRSTCSFRMFGGMENSSPPTQENAFSRFPGFPLHKGVLLVSLQLFCPLSRFCWLL